MQGRPTDPSLSALMDQIEKLKTSVADQEEKNKKLYLIIKRDKRQLKELTDTRDALQEQVTTLQNGGGKTPCLTAFFVVDLCLFDFFVVS